MSDLVIALDVPNRDEALALAERLQPVTPWMKVGLELFTAAGPSVVTALKTMGCRVFLDLKFHDIPNTVARAVRAAWHLGADMCDVHASGGREMVAAAAHEAAALSAGTSRTLTVLGVTVLTSSGSLSSGGNVGDEVERLAREAQAAGLAGVVCSGLEAAAVKAACGRGFVCLCPGIRPASDAGSDDQKRVMTPGAAVAAGADYLVVGRPVLRAENPVLAARRILEEMTV